MEGKGIDNPQTPLSRNLLNTHEPVLIHRLFYKVQGERQSCHHWERTEGGTEDAGRCCLGRAWWYSVEQSVHPMQDMHSPVAHT